MAFDDTSAVVGFRLENQLFGFSVTVVEFGGDRDSTDSKSSMDDEADALLLR